MKARVIATLANGTEYIVDHANASYTSAAAFMSRLHVHGRFVQAQRLTRAAFTPDDSLGEPVMLNLDHVLSLAVEGGEREGG